MIRAVLFDMDGVLFDTEALGFQTMCRITTELGAPIDRAIYTRTLGLPDTECRNVYLSALGQDFPYDVATRRFGDFMSQYSGARPMPRKPGLSECLAGLKARGIAVALATSTTRPRVDEYFATAPDLAAYFGVRVCCGEVPRGKPAPDIYVAAARAAGCEPADCLGVEDSLNGVRAVRASGARCVMIPDMLPYGERFRPYVDDCLASLAELCPLIDRLNAAK